MFHTNPAKTGCACNAAFNMLHARLCTCHTDYIDMNKPEYACLSYRLTEKGDKTLNVQYILHLKTTYHQGNRKHSI